MQAKIIKSGEIVEVEQVHPGQPYFKDCNNETDIYDVKELDFSVEPRQPLVNDDDENPISKLFGIKAISMGDISQKAGDASIKLKERESEIVRKTMKIDFKCDVVKILLSSSTRQMSIPQILDAADQCAKRIFNEEDKKDE